MSDTTCVGTRPGELNIIYLNWTHTKTTSSSFLNLSFNLRLRLRLVWGVPEGGEVVPRRRPVRQVEGGPRVRGGVGEQGGHQGQVRVRPRVEVWPRQPAVAVWLVAVHLTDQAGELGAVLRLGPEGELCQLFPWRVIASDVQGTDPQRRVLSHYTHRSAGKLTHLSYLVRSPP